VNAIVAGFFGRQKDSSPTVPQTNPTFLDNKLAVQGIDSSCEQTIRLKEFESPTSCEKKEPLDVVTEHGKSIVERLSPSNTNDAQCDKCIDDQIRTMGTNRSETPSTPKHFECMETIARLELESLLRHKVA